MFSCMFYFILEPQKALVQFRYRSGKPFNSMVSTNTVNKFFPDSRSSSKASFSWYKSLHDNVSHIVCHQCFIRTSILVEEFKHLALMKSMILWYPWCCDIHDVVISMMLWFPWCCDFHDVVISTMLWYPWCCDFLCHIANCSSSLYKMV